MTATVYCCHTVTLTEAKLSPGKGTTQKLNSEALIRGTRYRYQVPGTRYQVPLPGTRYQVPGTRYLFCKWKRRKRRAKWRRVALALPVETDVRINIS